MESTDSIEPPPAGPDERLPSSASSNIQHHPFYRHLYSGRNDLPSGGEASREVKKEVKREAEEDRPDSYSDLYPSERQPSRSYDHSPPRSYDRSPPRSYERSPPRSYDRSPPRSYDRFPPRSYDRSPPRSYDRSPLRTHDHDRLYPVTNDRASPRTFDRSPQRTGEPSPPRSSYNKSPPRSYKRSPPRSHDRTPPLRVKREDSPDQNYPNLSMPPIQSSQYVPNGYHSDYNSDDSAEDMDQDDGGHRPGESPLDFSVRRGNGGAGGGGYGGHRIPNVSRGVSRDNGFSGHPGRDSVSSIAGGSDKDAASPESAVTNGILSPNGNGSTSRSMRGMGMIGRQASVPGKSSMPPVSPTLPLPNLPGGVMNPAAMLAAGTFPFMMDPRQLQQMQLHQQKNSAMKPEDNSKQTSPPQPYKGFPSESLPGVPPLGMFGMPGLMPGLMPAMDPSTMQGIGLSPEDLVSQYRVYIAKAQEALKQQEKLTQRKPQPRRSSESELGNSPSSSTSPLTPSANASHLTISSADSTGNISSTSPTSPPGSSLNALRSPGSATGPASPTSTPHLLPPSISTMVSSLQGHVPQRRRPRQLPEDKKDNTYWDRRRKNNAAAKRSRDVRRAKEDEIAIRAAYLEQENLKLRVEVAALKNETAKLRCMLYNS